MTPLLTIPRTAGGTRVVWDVDLLVAGRGPTAAAWQAKVKQTGLENRIRLLGFTDQVKSVLAAADLLISPVRYESYGLNVQEAICRGVPAMVSASAGVAEQYHPSCAPLLIPDPENIEDLSERLLSWRSNQEHWRARFRPFGDRLRSRSWRDTAADFVAIVEEERSDGLRFCRARTTLSKLANPLKLMDSQNS